jgi:hypothetical protein
MEKMRNENKIKEAWCGICNKRVKIKSQNTEGNIVSIFPCKHCLKKQDKEARSVGAAAEEINNERDRIVDSIINMP